MNQFARRTLSLFLAITMVAGMLPMGALASEITEPEQPTTEVVQTEPQASTAVNPTETAATETAATEPTATVPADSEPLPSETETIPEETTLPTQAQEDVPTPCLWPGIRAMMPTRTIFPSMICAGTGHKRASGKERTPKATMSRHPTF